MKIVEVKRKELFAPVRIENTTDFFKGFSVVNDRSQVVVVDTPKGEHIVNFCSPGYSLIPCEEIVTPLEKAMRKLGKFNVKYQHDNFAKFFIDFLPENAKPIKRS